MQQYGTNAIQLKKLKNIALTPPSYHQLVWIFVETPARICRKLSHVVTFS